MAVYVDLVFLFNCLADAAALYVTARLSGLPVRKRRILAAALAGGTYGALCALPGLAPAASLLPQMAAAAGLVWLCFGRRRDFLRQLMLFFLLSCTMGGALVAACRLAEEGDVLSRLDWRVFFLCIVFIDEIDAIGKSRDTAMGGGNDEREQTLNQLLAEMDGFDTNKGLLLLAATNRPEVLDPALLRPGRFDRRIIVDKPDLKGRTDTLKVHSKDVKMDETVDLEAIALATSGAVGSDLANMINEAAINAVKHGRQVVSQKDLFEAVEVVLVGKEKKDRIMSKEERRIVSYHEVGHALVSALQKDAEPVQKITIVPRTMGALGYVMQTPEEEKFLNTKKELEAMLVGALAGRAAEELVFDTVTTGASNDIEKATKIARAMITQYGMSEKFGLIGLESVQHRYLDGRPVMNCGDATAAEIDSEVMIMLKNAYVEAKHLLSENREALDKIADFLIEKETITGKEFMKIFREVKGLPDPEEADDQPEEKEGRITMKETGAVEEAIPAAEESAEEPKQ